VIDVWVVLNGEQLLTSNFCKRSKSCSKTASENDTLHGVSDTESEYCDARWARKIYSEDLGIYTRL